MSQQTRKPSLVYKADPPVESKKWIEVKPFGLIGGPSENRSTIIFKNTEETETLPIWLHRQEAFRAILENNPRRVGSGVNNFIEKLLDVNGWELRKCYFLSLTEHHQNVRLCFYNKEGTKSVVKNSPVRSVKTDQALGSEQEVDFLFSRFDQACQSETLSSGPAYCLDATVDEVMGFCLAVRCQFFATEDFIDQCKQVSLDLEQVSKVLSAFPQLQADDEAYVM